MAYAFPRCRIVPLADHQVSFQVDGLERLRWHFGPLAPRPFFFPLVGPSGSWLTRMGHPGAPNHDHHRSIWFGHARVLGIDFWSDSSEARIRQQQWLAYEDGDAQAAMAVKLGWYDGHEPRPLLEQELIAIVRPADEGETLVELQSRFTPTSETLEFGQTNFGFLAVRVADSISAHFGGGEITSSEGATGEAALFEKRAAWVDYSGPVLPAYPPAPAPLAAAEAKPREAVVEGITYFDHPTNPGFPSYWHVRADGWMGAAVSMRDARVAKRSEPLVLRYLLHAHGGPVNAERAAEVARQFAAWPAHEVAAANVPHRQHVIRPKAAGR